MKPIKLPHFLIRFLLSIAIITLVLASSSCGLIYAQESAASVDTKETAEVSKLPDYYQLTEVASQAQLLNNQLQNVNLRNTSNKLLDQLSQQFETIQERNRERSILTHSILASSMNLEALQAELTYWQETHRQISEWNKEAGKVLSELRSQEAQFAEWEKPWKQTQRQATKDGAQPEIVERISHVVRDLTEAQEAIAQRIRQTISWQEKLAAEEIYTSEILKSLEDAQGHAFRQFFSRDTPAIWDMAALQQERALFLERGRGSLSKQSVDLKNYLFEHPYSIVAQALVTIVLYLLLLYMSGQQAMWMKTDPSIVEHSKVFEMPKSTAFLLSLLLSIVISPDAPPLFWAIWGAITLAPTIYVIHHITERPLWHLLRALVAFYVCELILSVTYNLPLFARALFLLELAGGILFCLWFLRHRGAQVIKTNFLGHFVMFGVRLSLVILIIALIANVVSYGGLSSYLASGLLKSAITALCLKALLTVANAIFAGCLHLPPLNLLRSVKRNRPLVRDKTHKLFRILAVVYWMHLTLELLSLKNDVLKQLSAWLNSPIHLGDAQINLGSIFSFFFAIIAAIYISRFIRFLLEEDLYPRVRLARGVPYAISTVLHYLILFVGFILAVAALGYDMTKFTILAGAFGVGLGFGMQNIVNNFVSGLIVLFERPLQVGDVVQIDSITGTVLRIGIRATILRVGDGSEIVVPNGKLISDRFTNWTLSDRKKRISVMINVSNQSEPESVMKLLVDCAKENPLIANLPSPQAYLVEFTTNSAGVAGMKLELSAWTNNVDDGKKIQSELAVTIQQQLKQMNIPLC